MKLSEALKQLGHPVAYYPTLSRIFGMQESVFLAQFVYWTGKESSGDGWIYKSVEDIELETGLTYEQQRRVRKELTGSHAGAKGRKIRRGYHEGVLEERYDRMQHKMYYKVNLEAMDRAFSNTLFSGLGQEHLDIVHQPPGQSPPATWTLSRSSTTETTTETTHNTIARKTAHKDFVKWWDSMTLKTRKQKVDWSPSDFRNLKIALVNNDKEKLEQLALYFLADAKFKAYAPTLRAFLSLGVMDALKNEQNREGFWHKVDGYAKRYLEPMRYTLRLDTSVPGVREDIKSFTSELAVKFDLARKFSLKKHD